MRLPVLTLGVLCFVCCVNSELQYAIMEEKNKTDDVKICVAYPPSISHLEEDSEDKKFDKVIYDQNWNGCDNLTNFEHFRDKFVIVPKNNICNFFIKAELVESFGAHGLILPSDERPVPPFPVVHSLNITIVFLEAQNFKNLLSHSNTTEVRAFALSEKKFDFSLLFLWLIAVSTLIIGAYWSGITRQELHTSPQFANLDESTSLPADYPKHSPSLNLTVKSVIFIIIAMCAFLLSLYFFYKYLVYFVIALYCIACVCGVYQCFIAIVTKIPCGTCKCPPRSILCIKGHIELREVLLILFSVSIVVIWFVFRKEPWSWILQNALGICFGVNLINTLRIPSLKICTVLLGLLFFYDIFFVFLTPYFTKPKISYPSDLERSKVLFGFGGKGESIMVEVATGGADGEQLPMVFKVPRFSQDDSRFCISTAYSFLGYGDVLVPGFFVAYCHGFDRLQETPKLIYFVVSVIAYGIGLILTFIALMLMAQGQPALLYIVPSCLIPIFIIALIRKEFKTMWAGHPDPSDPPSVPESR